MIVRLDATDFPVAFLPTSGIGVGLFPVTKVQFEYLLGESNGPGLEWYETVLAVSPRASWRSPPADGWDRLFLTAVTADEAADFAARLGGRLPAAAEWREADRALAAPAAPNELDRLAGNRRLHPAARAILRLTARAAGPRTWQQIGLFAGGLLEWVAHPGGGLGVYGRPPARLYKLLLDPQIHDPPRPLSTDRHPAFGFRVAFPPSPRTPGRT